MKDTPRSSDRGTGTPADDIYGGTTTGSAGTTGSGTTGTTGATGTTGTTGTTGYESTSDRGRDRANEWLAQLQSMIDNVATHAGPVARQIGAKAAELAAIAGEKAGPIAHKAAEVTAAAGEKVAERGRDLAADLRRDATTDGQGTSTSRTGTAIAAPDETTFGTSTTKDTPRE